jgi:hypothetical protein
MKGCGSKGKKEGRKTTTKSKEERKEGYKRIENKKKGDGIER